MVTPPRKWQLAYRLLGLRVPDEYKPWVARDVTTRRYVWWRTGRTLLWGFALVGLFAVVLHTVYRWPSTLQLVLLCCSVLAYSLLASGKSLVRSELRWQGIDRHGNPVPRPPLLPHDNAEIVVAALAATIVFAGAVAVVGYRVRPDTLSCAKPSKSVLDRLKAGLNRPDATFQVARQKKFPGGLIVAAALRAPATDAQKKYDQTFEIYVVRDDGIYRYGQTNEVPGWTNFPAPPSIDRLAPEALRDAVNCVTAAARS